MATTPTSSRLHDELRCVRATEALDLRSDRRYRASYCAVTEEEEGVTGTNRPCCCLWS